VLTDLGVAEIWAGRLEDAERELERALAQARQIRQPWLELQALSHLALANVLRWAGDQTIGERRAMQAIDLARAHGWEETAPAAATAYVGLASVALLRARLAEADGWLERAELVLRRVSQPTTTMMVYTVRALLEFARGRRTDAMAAQPAAESIERGLAAQHILTARLRAAELEVLVGAGETELVERALDEMDEEVRATSAVQRSRANCSCRPTRSAPICATCTSKLGVHNRADAVTRARELGLLSPSSVKR
jgi:LuxR family maltose regulon positive regulatory protein